MKQETPPKWPLRFFRWYCHRDYLEDIEGDLLERYERNLEDKNIKTARWAFTKDVIRLFRPDIIRPLEGRSQLNQYGMIKNYLKVAFRNIRRQQVTSLLNIMGLALGIAASFIIGLHIKQELSYESGFKHADNIYRVSYPEWAKSSPPLKGFLQTQLPEAKLVSQMAYFGGKVISTDIYKSGTPIGYFADKEFFQIFNLNVLSGNPQASMDQPYKVILTQKMAKQFFGDNDPVGKLLIFDGEWDCEVIGVVNNLPKNSHLQMDYFITMPTFYEFVSEDWTSNKTWMVTYTYILLNSQADISKTKTKLSDLTYDFLSSKTKEEIDNGQHLQMYPIKSVHLHSHREQEMSINSDITYIYIFSALAVFILLIACVNFVNIFTTQAIHRAKEIGVRKVLGAKKGQLAFQFLCEAFILTIAAAILGLLLVALTLPQYNLLVDLPVQYSDLLTNTNLKILGSIVASVALFSGVYPAFFVARQKTVAVLKSNKAPKSTATVLRKILVVFQFTMAVVMTIGTVVVFLQMKYIDNKNLGFKKDQVISMHLYGDFRTHLSKDWESFYATLKQNTVITDAALASNLIGDKLSVEHLIPEGTDPNEDLSSVRVMRVDEHYLQTMGIPMKTGRNFEAKKDTTAAFILNQKAVKMLHLENPIGVFAKNSASGAEGTIVGVVDNFNFASLHEEVEPLVLSYKPGWTSQLLVRLNGQNIPQALQVLEDLIKQVAPETLVDFQFLDTRLEHLYKAEANMSKIVNTFSLLALIISGLGLFGLMAYTTQLRTKEIGIRKTLGAGSMKIVSLLMADFTKLILIAIIFAIPISYLLAQSWLSNFAFRLTLEWWMFAGAGVITMLIAWFTIGFQTLKAANTNPAKCLRDE